MLAEHQIRVARRSGADVLIVCADVNEFKSINDRFGHAQGDATLRDVAALLRRTVRETDVVARLGGDEFAVLVVDGDADAERAIRARLATALAAHNARPEGPGTLSLAIGVARLDADRGAELDDLLLTADTALYRDKPGAGAVEATSIDAGRVRGERRQASAA
jgi:diguanylate cyclase (GGDEF)-like protein